MIALQSMRSLNGERIATKVVEETFYRVEIPSFRGHQYKVRIIWSASTESPILLLSTGSSAGLSLVVATLAIAGHQQEAASSKKKQEVGTA